jgi:UDP-glucose 4-epimerase
LKGIVKLKKVVITGGAGFIGSHLADVLITDNQVTIIDDLSTGTLNNITDIITNKNIKFIRESVLNLELLESIFQDVDFVFHLAAIPSVVRSINDPIATNEVNITGTLNVLSAARKSKVKKVVFASSSAVYGEASELPTKEDTPLNFQSPYALTKLTGEYYCRLFKELYRQPTICLRYFNVYGPRQSSASEYSAVIPLFLHNVLKKRSPVIYGDGNQTRDFVFVEDVVQANIIAAESEATGVFNIGSGESITINNLAQKIIAITGNNLQPTHKKVRIGEIRDSLADITLALKLGYIPKHSLDSGLRETKKSIRIRN